MSNHPSVNIPHQVSSNYVTVDNVKLHYLEAGDGEVVLMLHGFPTSAYLWRNTMEEIAQTHRVIALDLPGYGKSDKPISASYSLNFYAKILSGFLVQIGAKEVNLVVHDLGGPIGMLWAVRNREKIKRLVFLNTLVYADYSWAVILFGLALRTPFLKDLLTSTKGIAFAMKFGVEHKERMTVALLENYQVPFSNKTERQVLIKTASNISLKGIKEIEEKLPLFKIPVRAIYGENDRILPKVANTMERIKKDLPQTEITPIADCGHFLQEDKPKLLGTLLNVFLNK